MRPFYEGPLTDRIWQSRLYVDKCMYEWMHLMTAPFCMYTMYNRLSMTSISECRLLHVKHRYWELPQSSTLTTGPKVLASKNWLGLVKIGNLEVRRTYKHFTVNCYTSLNLPPTGGMVISSYVLTRKNKKFCTWCSENHVTDCKFDVSLHSILLKWEFFLYIFNYSISLL